MKQNRKSLSLFNERMWARVDVWRRRILGESTPIKVTSLAESMKLGNMNELEEAYQAAYGDEIKEDSQFRGFGGGLNPFTAMMNTIEMGEYPSPEILLTVRECWERYLVTGDMESAFLGRSVAKSGNYAARYQRFRRNIAIDSAGFTCIAIKGMTQEQAAVNISLYLESIGMVPPKKSAIVRMLRGKFKRKKEE